MPHSVPLHVNGKAVTVEVDDPGMPLLLALRNKLDLDSPRFGCGLGQCGACTIHIDGEAVRSCMISVSALSPAQKIVTLERLGSPDHPHPLQQAFVGEPAMQCGYCINGMIMQAAALLAQRRNPSAADIRDALADHACRCGARSRIVRAIQRAAQAQTNAAS
jgi:nicotinate dehydrogenase subunit A